MSAKLLYAYMHMQKSLRCKFKKRITSNNMMLMLVNLPDVILKHFQSFLSKEDILYFLNSNKLHFSSLRQEMIYFSLNKEKSRQYVEDERFREMILSKVKDGTRQIGLSFSENFKVPSSVIRDIIAHKINFVLPFPFSNFPQKVSSVEWRSTLSHLKRLELLDAHELTDITPLQNIPHLTFTDCPNIRDFSMLRSKRQHYLSIRRSDISDVSFFRNIETVELRFCDQIIDVSPLHGIKNLVLCYCSNIQDISGLGNHHRLAIADCYSIKRGYDCFRSVQHAVFYGVERSDITVFQEVKT